jgi:hypothetical protein
MVAVECLGNVLNFLSDSRSIIALLEVQRCAGEARGICVDAPRRIADLLKGRIQGWQRLRRTPKGAKTSRRCIRLFFPERIGLRIPRARLALFPQLEVYLNRP